MKKLNDIFGIRKDEPKTSHPFEVYFARTWDFKDFCNYRWRNFKKECRREFRMVFAFGAATGIALVLIVVAFFYFR
jgi:hypothetical protein